MSTITIREFGGKRKFRLNTTQRKLFEAELRRVRKYFPASKGPPALRLPPDCVITMTNAGKRSEYALYSRAVLMDTRTKKMWQFYFGILLLEWLYT